MLSYREKLAALCVCTGTGGLAGFVVVSVWQQRVITPCVSASDADGRALRSTVCFVVSRFEFPNNLFPIVGLPDKFRVLIPSHIYLTVVARILVLNFSSLHPLLSRVDFH